MAFLSPRGGGRGLVGVAAGFFRLWLHAVRPRDLSGMSPWRKLALGLIVVVLALHFFGWLLWGLAAGFTHIAIAVLVVVVLVRVGRLLYFRKWR